MADESMRLAFKEGSSDKVYNASLRQVRSGEWEVTFSYGRRGSALTAGTKTMKPVNYTQGKKIYDKLVGEKTSKGYKVVENSGSPVVIPVTKVQSGVIPQLLNPIEEDEVEKYLDSPDWCAQEKYDGRNRILISDGDMQVGANRKGFLVTIPDTFKTQLKKLGDCTLAGEDMGETCMIFDCLTDKSLTYIERYEALIKIMPKRSLILRLVPTAFTAREKRSLYKKLIKDNAEGIVFKNINSLYSPGRPASGGDQLKFKLYSTASCIVGKVNSKARSVSLMVYNVDTDKLVNIGNTTVYPNQEVPLPGAVVEVKYLYYHPGGSLFQPILLCKRDDINQDECTLAQLKAKREIAEV